MSETVGSHRDALAAELAKALARHRIFVLVAALLVERFRALSVLLFESFASAALWSSFAALGEQIDCTCSEHFGSLDALNSASTRAVERSRGFLADIAGVPDGPRTIFGRELQSRYSRAVALTSDEDDPMLGLAEEAKVLFPGLDGGCEE